MATSQVLSVSVIFLSACALAAQAEDLTKFSFIVRPPQKNISCFECNNYSYTYGNKTNDKNQIALLNNLCVDNPGKVTYFRKRCPSRNAKGCAYVKTDYSEFSSTQRNRRIFRVRRFCTDDLLKTCEKSESSRGLITLCTCDSDFCNSASAPLPSLGLLIAVVSTLRLL